MHKQAASCILAGFAALGIKMRVIGISDEALQTLGLAARIMEQDAEVISAIENTYGAPNDEIIHGIKQLARTEGVIAGPVYEGRAIRGLLNLAAEGRVEKNAKVLLMHLGGSPAIHAYAGQFGTVQLQSFDVWNTQMKVSGLECYS